jgi:chaperone required for assembly of F1-ATPase
MRELFENTPSNDPTEATRRSMRTVLPRRFYETATTVAVADGHAVRLDDKPVRTPARRVLAAPTLALAEAIAAEWQAQKDVIDPAKMPLTRLANAIIDGVAEAPLPVAEEIGKYLASDLLFYRAASPQGLVERQAHHWDSILDWARQALGADFKLGEGVVYVAQPQAALAAARAAIPLEPWRLGAVHVVTTLTGSALIALAMAGGALAAEAAWQAAHVDDDWNMAQWGRDEMAMARREFRFAEFQAAATVLACSP